MFKHTVEGKCPSCDEKLDTAHIYLKNWFLTEVKPFWPEAHVAWAFRNKEDQNFFFSQGKTMLKWPTSPHNCTLPDGTPCARALDLFEMNKMKIARFSPAFYVTLNAANESKGLEIHWGGKFKAFGDGDHFQLSNSVK